MGMLPPPWEPPDRDPIVVRVVEMVHANSDRFVFCRPYRNLDRVPAGEVVARDGDRPIALDREFLIVMPTLAPLSAGAEAFGVGRIEDVARVP